MASITTVANGDGEGDGSLKPVGICALVRQPRALQWFEGSELKKRDETERQAGKTITLMELWGRG